MMNLLKEKYTKEYREELREELKADNIMAVPTLKKIVVNIGMGEAVKNPQAIEKMVEALSLVTGQRPRVNKTNKAISNFGIRPGLEIGLTVTLRRDRMWDFFEKLVAVVLPRLKDFRGVPRKAFDGYGNYSLGIIDHTVFPEIDPNTVDKIRSLQVVMVTTAENNEDGFKLLEKLGMPFAKEEEQRALQRMEESIKKDKKEATKMKKQRQAEGKQLEEAEEES